MLSNLRNAVTHPRRLRRLLAAAGVGAVLGLATVFTPSLADPAAAQYGGCSYFLYCGRNPSPYYDYTDRATYRYSNGTTSYLVPNQSTTRAVNPFTGPSGVYYGYSQTPYSAPYSSGYGYGYGYPSSYGYGYGYSPYSYGSGYGYPYSSYYSPYSYGGYPNYYGSYGSYSSWPYYY